ncbi:fused DSP-PTPase phosphatase/NAD kinase-like protein [Clostridium oryzae]|uniref:Effector protein hopD2 n=1 Tax=Clostridium oryzae TaxID=1450648 RepID=A0A1V4I6Z1_9CLOT|nr:hypothetical protein [Clostridium oryzae]OPJ55674.1 effector protein hopD2 [Clostridium oryzae]
MNRKYRVYIIIFAAFLSIFPFLRIKTEAKQVFNYQNHLYNQSEMLLDSSTYNILPNNFRKTSDLTLLKKYGGLNQSGLYRLNISGSAQFSKQNLLSLLKNINTPLNKVVVDLREEPHCFINGIPASWSNLRKDKNITVTSNQILADEATEINNIKLKIPINFCNNNTLSIVPHSIKNEQSLAKSRKLSYIRIPVSEDRVPTDDIVDSFVKHIKQQPVDIWLHFHCRDGVSRTTTFMIMYDMMKNYNKVPADDIIKRQLILGNFNNAQIKSFSDQKVCTFLNNFYKYCNQAGNSFSISWSQWKQNQSVHHKKLSLIKIFPEVTSSYIKNSAVSIFLYSFMNL